MTELHITIGRRNSIPPLGSIGPRPRMTGENPVVKRDGGEGGEKMKITERLERCRSCGAPFKPELEVDKNRCPKCRSNSWGIMDRVCGGCGRLFEVPLRSAVTLCDSCHGREMFNR